jgi:hypothetical protein
MPPQSILCSPSTCLNGYSRALASRKFATITLWDGSAVSFISRTTAQKYSGHHTACAGLAIEELANGLNKTLEFQNHTPCPFTSCATGRVSDMIAEFQSSRNGGKTIDRRSYLVGRLFRSPSHAHLVPYKFLQHATLMFTDHLEPTRSLTTSVAFAHGLLSYLCPPSNSVCSVFPRSFWQFMSACFTFISYHVEFLL